MTCREWNRCDWIWFLSFFALASLAHGQSARLQVTTEYTYPTEFEVVPIQGVSGAGVATVGAVVIPRGFKTRTVGTVLTVDVALGHLDAIGLQNRVAAADGEGGLTELMVAAATGDAAETQRLLRKGANVNARSRTGSTALIGACAGGFVDIARMLIENGAHANFTSADNSSPLMVAARNGHLEVVELLLQKGASVQPVNSDGMTALLYAVAAGHQDIVGRLAKAGANLDFRNKHGWSALSLANNSKDESLVVLLTRLGAAR